MRRSKSLKVSQGHESILWKELLVNFTSFFFFSSSSVTFSFFSDTTKKRNAFTGTFFFLLLHLLLFPSKGKKKNQTYLLSQTLKFLTNVTNHFCSLFSTNLVKQVSTKFLHFLGKSCGCKTIDFQKSSKTDLLIFPRGEISPKSKELWSQANAFENNSTFQPNAA